MVIKTLINGKVTEALSFHDRGLHYGDGLFETIAVYQNRPLCLNEHLQRLERGCKKLNISTIWKPILEQEIASFTNLKPRAVLKIIITRGQGSRGYAAAEGGKPSRIIALYDWPAHLPDNVTKGINARFCQYRYSYNPQLAGIKHLNRLEQVLARSEWRDPTIAEGIVMDQENNIIEGTMSNLFYAKENALFTPDIATCGVAGVVRQKILELGPILNIKLNIQKTSIEALLAADEVFLCNSIIGLWPVKHIDNHAFLVGQLTQQINTALKEKKIILPPC